MSTSSNTPFPPLPHRSETPFLYRFFRALLRGFLRVYCGHEAHGVENVPATGGYMLVSNHASFLDPPLVGCRVARGLHFVAKRELFRVPVFGSIIRRVNAHPIDRGQVRRESMREYIRLMQDGHILAIFPEGTRTRDGEIRPFRAGVAMIAAHAQVPCVPAYIQGSFASWPRHRWFPRPAKVRVFYGPPFALPERQEGMASRAYYELCAQEMRGRVDALRLQVEKHAQEIQPNA